MKYRRLGRTGLEVSVLGFGCGSVGGLFVRGDGQDMERALARAIELGINYFDTAPSYGDGLSETNLGLALKELKPDVLVGTKVYLTAEDMEDIDRAVFESVEASLKRLGRDRIDLIQLHNPIGLQRQPDVRRVGADDVEVSIQVFQKLQRQGKVRSWGITGLGDTPALHRIVAAGQADTIQCCFNLINPTAGVRIPDGFPFQNYEELIDHAALNQMGIIGIRVLAGGALSGSAARHPTALQVVKPIASGQEFSDDITQARQFNFLVEERYVGDLVEAAIRFVITKPEVSTALVGLSDLVQLEQAAASVNRGPLPPEALRRLNDVWTDQTLSKN
jgi:aryl-alcohol dehydrogenase-like predicted oxidoreductase